MNTDKTEKHINSSDSLEARELNSPTNFESLTALVTSKPVHLEKLINLYNQIKRESITKKISPLTHV